MFLFFVLCKVNAIFPNYCPLFAVRTVFFNVFHEMSSYHTQFHTLRGGIKPKTDRYDDKGQLIPIETEAEWEMVEEVINTFVEDEENAD